MSSFIELLVNTTHLVAVEDVGQLVSTQLRVRAHAGPRPAHPHLTRRHRLELKVPLPLGDGVRLLRPEDAHLVPAGVLQAVASCRKSRGGGGVEMRHKGKKECTCLI